VCEDTAKRGKERCNGLGTNQEMDDQDSVLPGYVPYLFLGVSC